MAKNNINIFFLTDNEIKRKRLCIFFERAFCFLFCDCYTTI